MAVRKVNGHGVTGVLPTSSDAVQAAAAQPNFMPTQGPADHGGITAPGSSFKMSGGGQKKTSPQAPNKAISKLL